MRNEDILAMSVELTKAHLTNNSMDSAEVPKFIQSIYATLVNLHTAGQGDGPAEAKSSSDAQHDPKIAQVLNEDISGEEFADLDPWLAKRVPQRVARKLNRAGDNHPTVFDDYLICLEDGQKVKLLRPYVEKRFGLTFPEYMDKWGLPDDYPIAPPAFTKAKRALAQKAGLGSSLRGKRGKGKVRVAKTTS